MPGSQDQLDQFGGTKLVNAEATGYFYVTQSDTRWWFITPDGHGFISMGVNHFDLAALKYADNVHIFRERYGFSDEEYIRKGIVAPLREWGFNTIGWTEDQVSGIWLDPKCPMRLCPEWEYHHYKTAQMPYIYNFVFAEIENFNFKYFYPDVFSDDFAEWADYLARRVCVDMAEEPLLIGYADVPMPDFISGRPRSWAEGLDLQKQADLNKLKEIVRKYYEVTHKAIRRYDTNHMILGPRFNRLGMTPEWAVEMAGEFFDVLMCNSFITADEAASVLKKWSEMTSRPTLISDMGFLAPTELLDIKPGIHAFIPDQKARGEAYVHHCKSVLAHPYVLGFHWCGFLENRSRKVGIKNYMDEPYQECVTRMQEFNRNRLYLSAMGK